VKANLLDLPARLSAPALLSLDFDHFSDSEERGEFSKAVAENIAEGKAKVGQGVLLPLFPVRTTNKSNLLELLVDLQHLRSTSSEVEATY
jgi:hypothetical protein